MLPRTTQIWALICFFLVFQLATASSLQIVRARDDKSVTPDQASKPHPSATPTPTPTPTEGSHGNTDESNSNSKQGNAAPDASATNTLPPTVSNTALANANETTIFNGSFSTIPEGELPLKPTITPGWAVAGVIMIMTGLIYTLIGIKNRFVHSFFSGAFIVSLGVAVLIVYVMSVPVGNAAQGGYVVATVLAGCALGAASTFFKEITEGLGCALGGFCISMWLLCLVPGGLLTAAAAKAIFISVFTLVGFAFFFSRWTRDWAMIVLMSFSGATTVVLGVDSFSRAGLKEFWVYIWNINDQIFPLGANTYPVTRGIRVEAALIIIIFLIGIVSQIKLWRIVREKRAKKAAERADGQRDLEAEEENVGRQVQEQTARDRAEWEKVYGDGTVASPPTSHSSHAELVSDERKLRSSLTISTYTPSRNEGAEVDHSLEASNSQDHAQALMSAEAATEGKLMVRVACDDTIVEDDQESVEMERSHERSSENGEEGQKGPKNGTRSSRRQIISHPPEIVPLPFKVPHGEEGDDDEASSDGSSVAAFAGEEDDVHPALREGHGSTQRTRQSSKRDRRLNARDSLDDFDEGTQYVVEDHRSSLAVTIDGTVSDPDSISVISLEDAHKDGEIITQSGTSEKHVADEEKRLASAVVKENETEMRTATAKGKEKDDGLDGKSSTSTIKETKPESTPQNSKATGNNNDLKVATETKKPESFQKAQSLRSKDTTEEKHSACADNVDVLAPGATIDEKENDLTTNSEDVFKEQLEDPFADEEPDAEQLSGPVSLTKDRLPRSLSKVALSYRTNEWAKHLSLADAPEPDEIHIELLAESSKARKEVARLVDVEDLQKTADDDALPRANMKRSDSQLSRLEILIQKETSTYSTDMPSPRSPTSPQGMRLPPVTRRKSVGFETLAGEPGSLGTNSPIPEENEEQADRAMSPKMGGTSQRQSGLVSFASTHTLLGQREQWLRNKSQGNLVYQTNVPDQVDVFGAENDNDSLFNYPMYAAALTADADEVPLSQRREMMRSSANLSSIRQSLIPHRFNNGVESSENSQFNSHQPKRNSVLTSSAAREARLASFRHSVAQDLRTSIAGVTMAPMGAEAQRREMRRREQEQQDARFINRMRSGDLIEAHREVMRRMQNSAKE